MSFDYAFLINLRVPAHSELVVVTGAFDNWKCSRRMSKCSKESNCYIYSMKIPVARPSGREKFLFKFIVDGKWLCSEEYEKEWDNDGNENNVFHYDATMNCIHLQKLPECKVKNSTNTNTNTNTGKKRNFTTKVSLLNPLKHFKKSNQNKALFDSAVCEMLPPQNSNRSCSASSSSSPQLTSFPSFHDIPFLFPVVVYSRNLDQEKEKKRRCSFLSIVKHSFLKFTHLRKKFLKK